MTPGRSRRIGIFAIGVLASLAIVAVFFVLAWLLNDADEYRWIPRLLGWLYAALNPVLAVFERVILPVFPAPRGSGRVAIAVADIAVFLGWWWLVAVVADRFLARRHAGRGAA